ncbi:NAD(P)/FAD-dependent oxidoreductase [Gordonia sp. CPCC 205515]|uniref:flavin-containing monooxygenase n=1 Tax=Gordonia sp. CPCC 205515 TaxID=3140791 RepID=UPI003AF3C314
MPDHDVLIIGAGFSGLYQLYKLRELGFDAHIVEAGADVGGTWYWNRYPGARCDIESIFYSYSFDPELEQTWDWTERYSAQPEILAYVNHVADKHDLRKDIAFNTRITTLEFHDDDDTWTATTDSGATITARYVIAATGCLSKPLNPTFPGIDDFDGDIYRTWEWPHDGVDLTGKRVGVVGTGSSAVQTITAIAPDVAELTVFQRTPTYAVPAHNRPVAEELAKARTHYDELREASRMAVGGWPCSVDLAPFFEDLDDATAEEALDQRYQKGGLCYQMTFRDMLLLPEANDRAAEFVRARIKDIVTDPATAELLTPRSYPIAAKRMCVDTGYYEVYNRPNVTLVDIKKNPIETFTERGIRVGDTEYEFDVIILATGFDAMTGALESIDIQHGDQTLRDKWSHGPRTYLGLMSAGFPNLFTVTGPQSPSVLSNMMTSIEYHVEWITDVLKYLRDHGLHRIEPEVAAEDNWVNTNNDLADMTLLGEAPSWYMGVNVPGKPRVALPFVGGVEVYKQIGDGIAVSNYHGFEMV